MVRKAWAMVAAAALQMAAPAGAEPLKVAAGQRGNWDTSVSEMGQRSGIMKKHGLELEILYTAGGGETQQAVLSRSVDIGVAAGTLGVLGAASKGAPVRIIGAETTGAADLFWYVPAASPLQTVRDLAGKTVAYSTTGSSTHTILLMAQAQYGVAFKPTALGGLPGTYTQAMSGQVDVGWAAAPFGVEALEAGKIRTIFRGSDIDAARDQTIRVLIAHAAILAAKKPLIERYMRAYRETLDWMYSNPNALRIYAEFAGVPESVARSTRDQFFPRAAVEPDKISGLESIMVDGVTFKFLSAPLTPQQLKDVVQLQ